MLGNFSCFLSSVDFFFFFFFFENLLFQKNLSCIPSECQTVWVQIRSDILSGQIWVQTVRKGFQQTTKVTTNGNWKAMVDFLPFSTRETYFVTSGILSCTLTPAENISNRKRKELAPNTLKGKNLHPRGANTFLLE